MELTMTGNETVGEKDFDALRRAVEKAKELSSEQIAAKLAAEPWFEVAKFGAFTVQTELLGLRPDELPPGESHPDDASDTARVLKNLLDLGLSRYEPDCVG